jgi:predicted Zn-dependent protease
MTSLSVSRKLALLAALTFFLPWAFGQSGRDNVGSITSALRVRDFGKALQLLQPALQQSPKNAQLWTLQGIAFSGNNQEKDALASFRTALKISPDYLPALEGAAQLEYKAGSDAAIPLLQRVL